MNRAQQIQIPRKAFIDIYRLVIALDDYELDHYTQSLVKALETTIEGKLEAMARRQAFTEYKTAEPTTEDRETKRQNYLELVGVHKDWTSQKETPL